MKTGNKATENSRGRLGGSWHLEMLLGIGFALLLSLPGRAQQVTQAFTLQPGWNSIWLEVDPTNRQPAAVFKDLPLASVWTWSERVSATDFIQNPATAGWNRNQWLGWFPPENPEGVLANLYAILPARAYLVRLAGTSSITWSVTGSVSSTPTTWAANQYNLRGLPVDPDSPASFRDFFRHSPAHWNPSALSPTAIFRLEPDGHWVPAAADASVRRGEAYWVYTQGASDYPAPFEIRSSTGKGVHFRDRAYRATVTVANHTAAPRTLRFEAVGDGSQAVRVESIPTPGSALGHTPLSGYSVSLPAGGQQTIRLYLDRTKHPAGHTELLFSVTDQQGVVQHLGVTSEGAGLLGGIDTEVYPLAGLWVGTALVNAVGEVHGTNAAPPTATITPFPVRLLMHVDNDGAVRLLRSVTFAALPPVYTNVPTSTNSTVVLGSGTNVLVSDPHLLYQYQSRYGRSASLVRRFTAVQFDDAANPAGTPLSGSFATNGVLTGRISIPSGYATNPYFHRYHPDHDNLDSDYAKVVPEDFAIERELVFDFTPIGSGVPGFGVDGLDGTYRESVSGLHKVPLLVSGTFTLQRLSSTGVLNPSLP